MTVECSWMHVSMAYQVACAVGSVSLKSIFKCAVVRSQGIFTLNIHITVVCCVMQHIRSYLEHGNEYHVNETLSLRNADVTLVLYESYSASDPVRGPHVVTRDINTTTMQTYFKFVNRPTISVKKIQLFRLFFLHTVERQCYATATILTAETARWKKRTYDQPF